MNDEPGVESEQDAVADATVRFRHRQLTVNPDAISGLLDTSTVILLGRISAADLPDEVLISAITLAELSVGPLVAATDEERAARQSHLQLAESDFEPVPFDAAAARAFGRVAAALRGSGRKPSARAFDAVIAATAIAGRLPLYTCNPADFVEIPELDLIPVPHPDHVSPGFTG